MIYIGDVQTTIKCDQNDPILAVDEENKYMVVSVGSVHYMLLLEGSSFKGLQSVSYRRASAFDDYVEAMTLVDERGTVIMASSAVVSFRVLPADFKLEQAKFACEDVRQFKDQSDHSFFILCKEQRYTRKRYPDTCAGTERYGR